MIQFRSLGCIVILSSLCACAAPARGRAAPALFDAGPSPLVAPMAVQAPAGTAPGYPAWTVRGWAGIVGRYVEDDNVDFNDGAFGVSELSWNDPAFGLGFDVERRFSRLIGLDLGVGYTNMDIDFDHTVGAGTQTDSLGVIPIWLALNFHLVASEKLDLYLGPQIAYIIYLDDLSYDVGGVGTFDFDTDNEFPSLGFLFGADYWMNDAWGVNFAFRFQDTDADSDHDLPLDPTFVTLGISYRF
jgi:hypothetical protein